MKFIRLEIGDALYVWVNTRHIVAFQDRDGSGTILRMVDGEAIRVIDKVAKVAEQLGAPPP